MGFLFLVLHPLLSSFLPPPPASRPSPSTKNHQFKSSTLITHTSSLSPLSLNSLYSSFNFSYTHSVHTLTSLSLFNSSHTHITFTHITYVLTSRSLTKLTSAHTHITHFLTHSLNQYAPHTLTHAHISVCILHGRRGTCCSARGLMYALASLGLRGSVRVFCVAGAALAALQGA